MKQKLANFPLWLKRATPQASFWVFLHLKGPSINEVTPFYSFLTPFSSTLPIFYQIRHQIFLNFWLLPPIERRRCLWTALQVKLLWTKRSFLPFVLDEGTWVPVFLHSDANLWRMDGAAILEFTTGWFISIVFVMEFRNGPALTHAILLMLKVR